MNDAGSIFFALLTSVAGSALWGLIARVLAFLALERYDQPRASIQRRRYSESWRVTNLKGTLRYKIEEETIEYSTFVIEGRTESHRHKSLVAAVIVMAVAFFVTLACIIAAR